MKGDRSMDKKLRNKQNTSYSPQMPECPAGINLMKTGVICCMLDESLTFLWANSGFYRLTGYTAEDFYHLFESLQAYYYLLPGDYAAFYENIYRHICHGEPLQSDAREVVGVIRLIEAGWESSRMQRVVRI